MVRHYWQRSPVVAPTGEIRSEIEETIRRIKTFSENVHSGKISAEDRRRFKHPLHIGIGGSALGPQFVSAALGSPDDPMDIFFFDNTDPEGFDRVFERIGEGLPQTLVIVVSKSGGTKEIRMEWLRRKRSSPRTDYSSRGTRSPSPALEATWTNMPELMAGSRASPCPIGLVDARRR